MNAKIPVELHLLHIFAHFTFSLYLFMGCCTVWFKDMRYCRIWKLVGGILPLTHSSTLAIYWRGCVSVDTVLSCLPPLPMCHETHYRLRDYRFPQQPWHFQGHSMMIRLYSKWDITPCFPPFLPPLSSDFYLLSSSRCFILPSSLRFYLYCVHCCSSLPISSHLSIMIFFTFLALTHSNFFFMWLLETPSIFP